MKERDMTSIRRTVLDQMKRTGKKQSPISEQFWVLKTEKLQKKVTSFKEEAKAYILSNFRNAKDILLVLQLVNPRIDFKKKNVPKALEGDDKGKGIEEQMQTMRIKELNIKGRGCDK